jgi:hypothetical protein
MPAPESQLPSERNALIEAHFRNRVLELLVEAAPLSQVLETLLCAHFWLQPARLL